MPQELELVYHVESGAPAYMHSVDAAEACSLGDYTRMAPKGHDEDPKAMTAALSQARGMNPVVHPELQSPEERAEHRRVANAAAMPTVTVPTGTPVMFQAGGKPENVPAAPDHDAAHRRPGVPSRTPAAEEGKK